MKLQKSLQDAYKRRLDLHPSNAINEVGSLPTKNQESPHKNFKGALNSTTFLKIVNRSDPRQRPSLREIATLLLIIGSEATSKIVSFLPHDVIEKISLEIAKIKVIKPQERQAIIDKFEFVITEEKEKIVGGPDFAQKLLEYSVGKEQAVKIMHKVITSHEKLNELDFLNNLEVPQLKQLMMKESSKLLGIILSNLKPELAAELLKSMPNKNKSQIIHSMRKQIKLSQEVIHSIAESLKAKIRHIGTDQNEILDGKQILVEILQNMDSSAEKLILDGLSTQSPDIQIEMKERLFTIDQVIHLRDEDLQHILVGMSDEEIALLIKGKSEKIRLRFLNNVSDQRLASICETYQIMGPQSEKKVNSATRDFVDMLRRLEEQGEIILFRLGDVVVK